MEAKPAWRRYLRFWVPNIDVDDELTFHADALTEELVAAGMTRHPARADAVRRFGNVDRS